MLEKEISALQARNSLLQTELDRTKSEVTKLGRVLDTRGAEMEGLEGREGVLRREVEAVRRWGLYFDWGTCLLVVTLTNCSMTAGKGMS